MKKKSHLIEFKCDFFFIFCEYYETNKLSKHFFHNFEKSVNIMYKICVYNF